ncbi:hypothetical protein V1515DRAFT_579717 [Lipomyces mesembrius]
MTEAPKYEGSMWFLKRTERSMGALEGALDLAGRYALDRKQFKSNPLAKSQLIQKKLADALTDISYGLVALMEIFGGNAASDEYDIGCIAANLFTKDKATFMRTPSSLVPYVLTLALGPAITGVNAFY